MSFWQIFELMLPIIIMCLAGYMLSLTKKLDTQTLSNLVIYVTAPCLFVISLGYNVFEAKEILLIVGTGVFVMIAAAIIVWLIKNKFPMPTGMYLPIVFMNTGFIGLPLILMIFGPQGLARAIIYDAVCGILVFSVGIYILSGKNNKWEIFKLPIFYATIIGGLINYFHFMLPKPIFMTINILGSVTIPLALITLGYQLGHTKIKSLVIPFWGAFLRTVIGLALAFIVVKIFNVQKPLSIVLLLMSSLPSALMSIVLSEKYRSEDSNVVASTIAISTLAAIIYIPLILFFIK